MVLRMRRMALISAALAVAALSDWRQYANAEALHAEAEAGVIDRAPDALLALETESEAGVWTLRRRQLEGSASDTPAPTTTAPTTPTPTTTAPPVTTTAPPAPTTTQPPATTTAPPAPTTATPSSATTTTETPSTSSAAPSATTAATTEATTTTTDSSSNIATISTSSSIGDTKKDLPANAGSSAASRASASTTSPIDSSTTNSTSGLKPATIGAIVAAVAVALLIVAFVVRRVVKNHRDGDDDDDLLSPQYALPMGKRPGFAPQRLSEAAVSDCPLLMRTTDRTIIEEDPTYRASERSSEAGVFIDHGTTSLVFEPASRSPESVDTPPVVRKRGPSHAQEDDTNIWQSAMEAQVQTPTFGDTSRDLDIDLDSMHDSSISGMSVNKQPSRSSYDDVQAPSEIDRQNSMFSSGGVSHLLDSALRDELMRSDSTGQYGAASDFSVNDLMSMSSGGESLGRTGSLNRSVFHDQPKPSNFAQSNLYSSGSSALAMESSGSTLSKMSQFNPDASMMSSNVNGESRVNMNSSGGSARLSEPGSYEQQYLAGYDEPGTSLLSSSGGFGELLESHHIAPSPRSSEQFGGSDISIRDLMRSDSAEEFVDCEHTPAEADLGTSVGSADSYVL